MIRATLRHLFLSIAGRLQSVGGGVHLLNGHFISRNNPSAEAFYELLHRLSKHCDLVNADQAISLVASGKASSRDKLVAFTFDDGFEECFTMIAPILENFGIRGLFFVNPNFIDGNSAYQKHFTEQIVKTPNKRPMGWEQIIALSKQGHFIGSHTLDHTCLNITDQVVLEQQIGAAKRTIEQRIGLNCPYFAFPFGKLTDVSSQAIAIAKHYHPYLFLQDPTNYSQYLSFDGQVINRRHFEGNWPLAHVKYFLGKEKKYSLD